MFRYMLKWRGEGGEGSLERKLKVGGIWEQRSQLRKRIPLQVFSRGFVFILLSNLPLLKKKKKKSANLGESGQFSSSWSGCCSVCPHHRWTSVSAQAVPSYLNIRHSWHAVCSARIGHTASSARVISTSDKRDGEDGATARKHVVLKWSDGTFPERVNVDMFFSRRATRVYLDFRAIDMELKYRVVSLQQQCLLNRHVVTAVVSRYETGN
jgi:hypothetical protein